MRRRTQRTFETMLTPRTVALTPQPTRSVRTGFKRPLGAKMVKIRQIEFTRPKQSHQSMAQRKPEMWRKQHTKRGPNDVPVHSHQPEHERHPICEPGGRDRIVQSFHLEWEESCIVF
jgi:hypothetical protein